MPLLIYLSKGFVFYNMTHSKKERYLDCERFVRWTVMSGQFNSYVLKGAVANMIKGTEHIVDLDGLQAYVNRVPGYLFDDVLDSDWVTTSSIILTYNPNKDEIEIPKDFS